MPDPWMWAKKRGGVFSPPAGWGYRVIVIDASGRIAAMDVARESAVTKAADQCLAALVRETLSPTGEITEEESRFENAPNPDS